VEIPDNTNKDNEEQEQEQEQENNNDNNNNNNNVNNFNNMNIQNMNLRNQINNMNKIRNNQINQINMQNNMLNLMQANMMANYQAEIMRMNYISNMEHLNSNIYSPYMSSIPNTDNYKVELLENFFSNKNLNRDLNLRKNMDPETGNVPIDFILNLNKIRSMNLNQENISELIDKVGSDIIEIVTIDDKLYLRRKNFEEIKNKLKDIDEMEKEYQAKLDKQKQQQQQQSMPMNIQPIPIYPVQPFMYYSQMMMPPQQPQSPQQPQQSK
jgi:hypothetical protein